MTVRSTRPAARSLVDGRFKAAVDSEGNVEGPSLRDLALPSVLVAAGQDTLAKPRGL
jgi:hypothetical protein